MTPRRARVLMWLLAGINVVFTLATGWLVYLNRSTIQSFADVQAIGLFLPWTLTAVGLLITTRQPHNRIGWLFLLAALTTVISAFAPEYGTYGLQVRPGAVPGAIWGMWVGNWSTALVYPTGFAAFLLLLFPTGRLPSPRWRPLAVIAVMGVALFLVVGIFQLQLQPTQSTKPVPNPVGLPALAPLTDPQGIPGTLSWMGGIVVLFACAVSLFVRLRTAAPEEKQQVKWLTYAMVGTMVADLAVSGVGLVGIIFPDWVYQLVIIAGFGIGLPASTAIAIFKYRLYDIDVVISRTLVYAALAAFITAVYVGVVVGIGSLAGSGRTPNVLLSIVATAVVAVVFQPLRNRLTRVANRLVYGARATPYEVLSEFSERVAESIAADEVLPRMARVLGEGTAAQHAQVWLRSGATLRPAADWPANGNGSAAVAVTGQLLPPIPGVDLAVPVRHQGELLGALAVRKKPGEGLTPIEAKLLDDLANQAGLVLRNVGLTSDLQARLEELRESRKRLVSAQDEERRRLERNLHDGAQQHLVALKVKIGLTRAVARQNPEKADELLDQLGADADEALETMRDLARGIYPPLLADQGLTAALQAQARKATVEVAIDADGVGRYPQQVEAAVYFCVLEALQNVQKYAGATKAIIRLEAHDGALTFAIEDDGKGFDPETGRRGAGLTNMADRLDALGGELEVTSAVGQGTRISGRLPVGGVDRVAVGPPGSGISSD